MLIVSTNGATNISDAHKSESGVFEVDHETATHLLQFPGWRHATEDEARAFTGTLGEPADEQDTEPVEAATPAVKRTRKPRTAPPAE